VARAGFTFSQTNDLIQNFKKPVNRRHLAEYRYKDIALRTIAAALREAINEEFLAEVTVVPIPPSKCKDDQTMTTE